VNARLVHRDLFGQPTVLVEVLDYDYARDCRGNITHNNDGRPTRIARVRSQLGAADVLAERLSVIA